MTHTPKPRAIPPCVRALHSRVHKPRSLRTDGLRGNFQGPSRPNPSRVAGDGASPFAIAPLSSLRAGRTHGQLERRNAGASLGSGKSRGGCAGPFFKTPDGAGSVRRVGCPAPSPDLVRRSQPGIGPVSAAEGIGRAGGRPAHLLAPAIRRDTQSREVMAGQSGGPGAGGFGAGSRAPVSVKASGCAGFLFNGRQHPCTSS